MKGAGSRQGEAALTPERRPQAGATWVVLGATKPRIVAITRPLARNETAGNRSQSVRLARPTSLRSGFILLPEHSVSAPGNTNRYILKKALDLAARLSV